MLKHMRRDRHRVFIFGAGVSASCGIAVAKDILRESVVRLAGEDAAAVNRIHSLLEYLYPSFDRQLRNYPNIEDFLNLLEMARVFNSEEFIASTLWDEEKLKNVRETTLRAVTDYLWGRMHERHTEQPIREFIRTHLHEGDTLITFNWDLTIERTLEEYPGDPGFLYTYSRKRSSKQFSLLKPHGSVDWFRKVDLKGLHLDRQVGSLDNELCYYPRFNRAENPKLAQVAPVLVPPVASKNFEYEFLKRTWRFVYRAVSDATSLQIIGYSMPKEDQFARLVLRRSIRNNIIKSRNGQKRFPQILVVNPDENVEGTFSRLFGSELEDFHFYQAYFQDYVAGLQE